MKKTLIALTLAALPVASMAEVVLYGGIKGGVEVTKVNGVKGTKTEIVDYGSRIGFKGKEQLNDSLKAIWQLEQKVNIGGGRNSKDEPLGFGSRNSFIGLESPAGTVKVGHMLTPIADVNGKLDQWEYTSDAAGLGTFGRGNDVAGRRLGASYTTPNMAGFSATAFVSPSDNNRRPDLKWDANLPNPDLISEPVVQDKEGKNRVNRRLDRAVYGVGASYQQPGGGFFADVAAGYQKNAKNNVDTKPNSDKLKHAYQAVAQVGYEANNAMLGVAYQRAQNVDKGFARAQEVAASAAYTINNALTVKGSAAYGFKITDVDKNKLNGNGKYMQGIVGADYNLSKRTAVNGQVGYLQFGKKEANKRYGTVGVGMSHKF